jgi:hypothetical protein
MRHFLYWSHLPTMACSRLRPVADPAGCWGIAIVEAETVRRSRRSSGGARPGPRSADPGACSLYGWMGVPVDLSTLRW